MSTINEYLRLLKNVGRINPDIYSQQRYARLNRSISGLDKSLTSIYMRAMGPNPAVRQQIISLSQDAQLFCNVLRNCDMHHKLPGNNSVQTYGNLDNVRKTVEKALYPFSAAEEPVSGKHRIEHEVLPDDLKYHAISNSRQLLYEVSALDNSINTTEFDDKLNDIEKSKSEHDLFSIVTTIVMLIITVLTFVKSCLPDEQLNEIDQQLEAQTKIIQEMQEKLFPEE